MEQPEETTNVLLSETNIEILDVAGVESTHRHKKIQKPKEKANMAKLCGVWLGLLLAMGGLLWLSFYIRHIS